MSDSQLLSLSVTGENLRVDGVLDFDTAAHLSPQLLQCVAQLPASFAVDLSGLRSFNSAVLVFMLDCMRMSGATGKHCRFVNAKQDLLNMLKMASLDELVQTTGS